MNEGKIVIIEGTSCVGKTTLCNKLKKEGWTILPESIRYLEKEKNKVGDAASPIPNSKQEEEFYQDELFRVEKQKLFEANRLRKNGKNVVIDKSAIAIVATAKAFEKSKGFDNTFKRAYLKYIELLKYLNSNKMIECDDFILLTADYKTILTRNKNRNHKLENIWIDEKTIFEQRNILEVIYKEILGKYSGNIINKSIIDTTYLEENDVFENFNKFIKSNESKEIEI